MHRIGFMGVASLDWRKSPDHLPDSRGGMVALIPLRDRRSAQPRSDENEASAVLCEPVVRAPAYMAVHGVAEAIEHLHEVLEYGLALNAGNVLGGDEFRLCLLDESAEFAQEHPALVTRRAHALAIRRERLARRTSGQEPRCTLRPQTGELLSRDITNIPFHKPCAGHVGFEREPTRTVDVDTCHDINTRSRQTEGQAADAAKNIDGSDAVAG